MNTEVVFRRVRPLEDAPVFKQVWEWMHTRPWFYPDTGGNLSEAQYLARAARITQADFAFWQGGELFTLITTELDAPHKFNFHITSRRKPDPQAVINAVYTVGWNLFDKLNAKQLYTYVPSFHHGSRRVAEACGLAFLWRVTDAVHQFHGKPLVWHVYGMNRAEFREKHHGRRSNESGRESLV